MNFDVCVLIESIKTFSFELMKGQTKFAENFNKEIHKWINEKTVSDAECNWEA